LINIAAQYREENPLDVHAINGILNDVFPPSKKAVL
jgi:hypothetical protein